MRNAWFREIVLVVAGIVTLTAPAQAAAQASGQANTDQRWYQIEVTVFMHNSAMLAQEHWPLETLQQPLPASTRRLDRLTDVLSLPQWRTGTVTSSIATSGHLISEPEMAPQRPETAVPLHNTQFILPDPDRDAFLALPPSAHGFTDTNRALAASDRYRVLYHDAWRQPLTTSSQAVPLWISGGQAFGGRHELEGTLTMRFNAGRDRVVLDARLWLTQFSRVQSAQGQTISLPALPAFLSDSTLTPADSQLSEPDLSANLEPWFATQIIPVLNLREMRSNEFHYVDHPAVGIVVHVFPYTVPPLPVDAATLL